MPLSAHGGPASGQHTVCDMRNDLMTRKYFVWLMICLGGVTVHAQDLDSLQIHGFVTQGMLYSTQNNYIIADTSDGSFDWTEAALTITDRPTPKLRIGIQLHYYRFSDLGSNSPIVDWALGDYQVTPYFGIRAGKVKTPFGLFNDTQDIDPVLLWSLLPQSAYANDNRAIFLAHYGGEVYGSVSPKALGGKISYRFFGGPQAVPSTGGQIEQLSESTGLIFDGDIPAKVGGADIRWQTPFKPLLIGSSLLYAHTKGIAENGSIEIKTTIPVYYAKFESGRYYAAGEYRRQTNHLAFAIGPYNIFQGDDTRIWYAMFAYRAASKLQLGTYYSRYADVTVNASYAANNSKDLVVSGRYDFNGNFYAKAETHFLHGEGLGYYPDDNPGGVKPRTQLVVAKLGFSF